MVREFEFKGEIFRATWHGIAGHEEVFILHIDKNEEEGGEASIDRMTEENDTSAPLEDILVMLCERIMPEIEDHDPSAPFAWRNGKTVYNVHNGVQALGH